MFSLGKFFYLYQPVAIFSVVIFILLTVKYYYDRRKIFLLGSKLPGPRCWPFIGNLLELVDFNTFSIDYDLLSKMKKYDEIYNICAIWIGHHLNVFINCPEYAEIFCKSNNLLDRADLVSFFKPVLGKGLLFSSDAQWRKAKKIMDSAFPYLTLKSFVDLIQTETETLIQRLNKEVGKKNFLLFPYVRDCTFDIICSAAFEFELKAQEGDTEFLEWIELLKELTMKRAIAPWQQLDCLYKITKSGQRYYKLLDNVNRIFDEHLEKRIKYFEEEQKIQKDEGYEEKESHKLFWRKLLENKNLDKEELRHHVYSTIAAGYETTVNSICLILVMLALYEDVQEKTYNEVISIVDDGVFDNEKLQRLEYLERVINETLRLFPTVPINPRKCNQNVRFGEHLVPAGSDVLLNIFGLHRNPEQFQNPNQFNPDNFLPENVAKRHPYSFIPFSAGPRRCIGNKFAMMQLKIIAGTIIMNYKVECDYKNIEEIPLRAEITLKMSDDCPIRLLNR